MGRYQALHTSKHAGQASVDVHDLLAHAGTGCLHLVGPLYRFPLGFVPDLTQPKAFSCLKNETKNTTNQTFRKRNERAETLALEGVSRVKGLGFRV